MVLLRGSIRSCCPAACYLLLTGWSSCLAGLGCTGTPVYLSAQVSPQAETQTNDAQSGKDKWTVPRGARGASCWLVFLYLPGISENLRKCKEVAYIWEHIAAPIPANEMAEDAQTPQSWCVVPGQELRAWSKGWSWHLQMPPGSVLTHQYSLALSHGR